MSKLDAMNDSAHHPRFPASGKDMEGKVMHEDGAEPAYVGKGGCSACSSLGRGIDGGIVLHRLLVEDQCCSSRMCGAPALQPSKAAASAVPRGLLGSQRSSCARWMGSTSKLVLQPHSLQPEVGAALGLAGQWYHIGFHVTAAVASVPTLGLPYAIGLMGWAGGLVSLMFGGAVTLFTAFLIAGMAEYGGKRHIRFRDLSAAIYGTPGADAESLACTSA